MKLKNKKDTNIKAETIPDLFAKVDLFGVSIVSIKFANGEEHYYKIKRLSNPKNEKTKKQKV